MSHMSIIQPTGGDVLAHHRFVGEVDDQDLVRVNGRYRVAKPDNPDDDPLIEEIEWGLGSSTLPGICRNRGHEGLDHRVHNCNG